MLQRLERIGLGATRALSVAGLLLLMALAAMTLADGLLRVLDAFAALAALAVIGAMAWQFTVFAGKIARVGETTWILKIPTAPFWYVVAGILWLAVAVQLIVLILDIAKARK